METLLSILAITVLLVLLVLCLIAAGMFIRYAYQIVRKRQKRDYAEAVFALFAACILTLIAVGGFAAMIADTPTHNCDEINNSNSR